MTDEAKIDTEIKIIQQPTTERTQARGAIVPPTVIPVWEALRNNDTFPSLDITDDTTDDEINRFLYGNDYDLDAEIKLIQQHMHQSCVKRLIADGMTEEEASVRAWEIIHAPWPAHWPPLPTFEELDGPTMTDAERAKLVAWLMTDPLPELTNVITVREITNTDELAVCAPRPGCPLPQGSWGTIVGVWADVVDTWSGSMPRGMCLNCNGAILCRTNQSTMQT